MKKVQDIYKETRVFELPIAIVRVSIPEIDDEENNKRLKQLQKAAAEVLKALHKGNERNAGLCIRCEE